MRKLEVKARYDHGPVPEGAYLNDEPSHWGFYLDGKLVCDKADDLDIASGHLDDLWKALDLELEFIER